MAFQPEAKASVSWPGYVWIVIVLGAFAAAAPSPIPSAGAWRTARRSVSR